MSIDEVQKAMRLRAIQEDICFPCEESSSCRYDPSGKLIPVPDWQLDSAPSLDLCKAHPFLQALQSQSAPKVLWRKTMDAWGAFYSLGLSGSFDATMEGQVEVVVLECQPKGKQEEGHD